jgi:hypothetical protein
MSGTQTKIQETSQEDFKGPLDIVTLIQNNPLTCLPENDYGELVNKIKETFSSEEQQLFVGN